MTTEQIVALISAITGLAGVAVGGFGLWLGYRAPSLGLQEALHLKQIEAATEFLESVVHIHKQLTRLAISRDPNQTLSDDLQITSNEGDRLLVLMFDHMVEMQRWRAILPAAVIEAHDRYIKAVTAEAGDPTQATESREAYVSLITTIRRELGVEPLSERTMALMRGSSKTNSILPW